MEKVTFQTKDGLQLVGIWHLPKKPIKKAIILAHGITVDKDEYGTFVTLTEQLCTHGFAVFRFDFRGHGESKGESINMTVTGELKDLAAAVEEVLLKGYQEIGLLGMSFGGGIATLYSSEQKKFIK